MLNSWPMIIWFDCCWFFANSIIDTRIKFPEDSKEEFSGEDFSSNVDDQENGAEDFGSLINASNEDKKKSTMDHLMTSVENIQKSVNQLAAAVTVTKNIDDNVTPSPDASIPTTSRRSVDIESLIANKKEDDSETKKGKNNKKHRNKGLDAWLKTNDINDTFSFLLM